jgi:E3 ubiquitin-protein ligase Hakai
MHPHPQNFMMHMNMNQPLIPNASFNYPIQQEGTQQYFSAPFQMQLPDGALDQGSASGAEGLQRPWGMGLMGNPSQGVGGMTFMQAGFGMMPDGSMNPGMQGQADRGDGRGVQEQMPMVMQMQMSLPPPPPAQPPSAGQQQSFNRT